MSGHVTVLTREQCIVLVVYRMLTDRHPVLWTLRHPIRRPLRNQSTSVPTRSQLFIFRLCDIAVFVLKRDVKLQLTN